MDKGHMDNKVRMAISHGVDPVTAIQMATINVAEYFRVAGEIGSLAPGKMADLVVVDDLENFTPILTLASGRFVSGGAPLDSNLEPAVPPEGVMSTINTPRPFTAEDFAVSAPGLEGDALVRVFGVIDGSLVSQPRQRRLEVRDGEIVARSADDVLKIAVAERHRASGRIGRAFVEGFGFRDGAVAMTYCHVFHNLLVIGSNDSWMAEAANAVRSLGGGVAVVSAGDVIATWRLPVVGVMGDEPLDQARRSFDQINDALRAIGCELGSPILSLSFIALPTIPAYGLSDRGLFDVQGQRFVDLVLDGKG
ncbi:MAG: adenine deaminase C-terminal domain-containing protein [Acidimicrobiia bacterium]